MLEECIWGISSLRNAFKRQKNKESYKWSPLKKAYACMLYILLWILSIFLIAFFMVCNKINQLKSFIFK